MIYTGSWSQSCSKVTKENINKSFSDKVVFRAAFFVFQRPYFTEHRPY
ncbi:hypothetical protein SAMN05444673_0102 [Bacillus sp. OV166]|nr:hypothetical protein SAMN05444673_0102 [Bacillus sp. OV166]